MANKDKWWLSLKSGDRVYVPMQRNRESGMAEVYSNAKKYIHVSLFGTPMRVIKSTGCIEGYPGFQICKDEKDFMDAVWQRKRMRDKLDSLSSLLHQREFRPTAEDADRLEALYAELIGDAK